MSQDQNNEMDSNNYSEEIYTFQVSFKGKTIEIDKWPVDSTIRQLKKFLEYESGVPADFQKLMFKGMPLKDHSTLYESVLSNGAKVMLIGSSQKDVDDIKHSEAKIVHHSKTKPKSMNLYKNKKPTKGTISKHTFHRIEVIEHFPEPEKARKILEQLRDDRGIRAIMEKHKFSVGTLKELTPAEANILGYNLNGGESISLRLRTNDMEGFRHYPSIRNVLLHELTHNVFTGHGDDFHRLNRQLNKEVVELDWTQSKGQKIGHIEYFESLEDERVGEQLFEGGAFRLGGGSDLTKSKSRREILAQAALTRLTKEEQEIEEGCGLGKD
ncbi:hypothetical protein G9A89_001894 [Geosiphon pyriformis]|nr:hypothetical protein G9A89_001894 [Geosiphon pyriformis]